MTKATNLLVGIVCGEVGLMLILIWVLLFVVLPENRTPSESEMSTISSLSESEDTSVTDGDVAVPQTNDARPIDFQNLVDGWAGSVSGRKGIVIYDLDAQEVVGEYNATQKFPTASLYKLFVAYDAYDTIALGNLKGDEEIAAAGRTILQCLDLAIRESNSECAEAIWRILGQANVDKDFRDKYGFKELKVSDLTATPLEILKIMQMFYEMMQNDTLEFRDEMVSSFLNQPATEYDWRQGLPRGFTDEALVYNKVGWEYSEEDEAWNIYNDAAIVEFPAQGRKYIVVVMTGGVDPLQIRRLGQEIEKTVDSN